MILRVVADFDRVKVYICIQTITINMAVLILLAHILVAGSAQGGTYWDSLKKEKTSEPEVGKAMLAYIIDL